MLDSFLSNYNAFAKLAPGESILDEIFYTRFVLRLCFYLDYHKLLGLYSLAVQKHEKFTWIADQDLQQLIEIAKGMVHTLDGPRDEWTRNDYLRNLSIAVLEISATHCFRGERMRDAVNFDFSDALATERVNFIQCLNTFVSTLSIRLRQHTPALHTSFANLFDPDKVLSRTVSTVPGELRDLYDRFHNILFGGVEYEVIEREYVSFQGHVHSARGRARADQVTFYLDLLHSKCTFPNVAHLLASAITRSYCESVIEGVGSVAKKLYTGRENLRLDNFRASLFVKQNGPEIGPGCQTLLEDTIRRKYGPIRDWRFFRVSQESKLKKVSCSKVVDRMNAVPGRLTE
jgi:hypothetical protein